MRRSSNSSSELDLVPVMNMVAILIPFLLFSAQFVELSVVENTLPGMVDAAPQGPEEPLALRVKITEEGYEVAASASALPDPVEIGCVGGWCRSATMWNTDELAEVLVDLKAAYPDEQTMIVEPGSDVPYEVLISTMDAARAHEGRPLFPSVMVAGGRLSLSTRRP